MRKIILITIICFLTPCFGIAQEPDSIFSIEGTLWRVQWNGVHLTPYPPYVEAFVIVGLLGFSDGKMFACVIPEEGDTCTPDVVPKSSTLTTSIVPCWVWPIWAAAAQPKAVKCRACLTSIWCSPLLVWDTLLPFPAIAHPARITSGSCLGLRLKKWRLVALGRWVPSYHHWIHDV